MALALVVAAWFAGPVAPRTRLRAMRSRRSCASARGAVMRSPSRLMALIFIWNPLPATGKPAGIIVFTLLALLGT